MAGERECEGVCVCVCVFVCVCVPVVGGWRMAECSEVRGSIHSVGVFSGRLGSGQVGSGESACILRNTRAPSS